MKAERPLKVVFFKTDTGNEPVREWLKELSKDDCKVIGTDILTVQYAWPVGKPLVDNLGDGIWEVRSRLDNLLGRQVEAAKDKHGLSTAQVEKIRLAGRGDIKRLIDQVEARRKEFEVVRMNVQEGRQYLSDLLPMRSAYRNGPFDEQSLFAKTLRTIVERLEPVEAGPSPSPSPSPSLSRR